MTGALRKVLPKDIVEGSIFFPLTSAYLNVIRDFEKRTGHSQTRLLILFLFRNQATYNQNQLAVAIGADRTVVHRVVKTMVREGWIAEKREANKKSIELRLTEKGEEIRSELIQARRAIDRQLLAKFSKKEARQLIDALTSLDEIEFD